MCNAWNHSADCRCGFGGEGHLGGGGSSAYSRQKTRRNVSRAAPLPDFQKPLSLSSFVNPNAACPVCGAAVFYYRSPSGGSVFFDELGPPWPKHPCTDHPESCSPNRLESHSERSYSNTTFTWQRENWQPFVVTESRLMDPVIMRLTGTWQGKQLSLYLPKNSRTKMFWSSLEELTPYLHLKKIGAKQYQIALFSLVTGRGTVEIYESIAEARKYLPKRSKSAEKRRKIAKHRGEQKIPQETNSLSRKAGSLDDETKAKLAELKAKLES